MVSNGNLHPYNQATDVADCWPGAAPPPRTAGTGGVKTGAGCSGTYHVRKARTQNLLVGIAEESAASSNADAAAAARLGGDRGSGSTVLVNDAAGECRLVDGADNNKDADKTRVLRLDFEEGPCEGERRTSSSSVSPPPPPTSSLPPERQLACTARTYAGRAAKVARVDLLEFAVDVEVGQGEPRVVESGGLAPNARGLHLVYPGHTGRALDVERFTGTAQIATADLGGVESPTDSFTVSLWLRKQDPAVSAGGDALFSWAPEGALTAQGRAAWIAGAGTAGRMGVFEGSHAVVLLMPDASLNYTDSHRGVVCTAVSPPVPHLRDRVGRLT